MNADEMDQIIARCRGEDISHEMHVRLERAGISVDVKDGKIVVVHRVGRGRAILHAVPNGRASMDRT